MLSGFILLGQTKDGEPYKPLIDYFVIEAFKSLQKEYGWAILKPCLTALHTINYRNELLFQYIVSCIVKQLNKDINELPYNSDLCFHLPREKSFTWGWFSFDIAKAYYTVLFYKRKELRGKELRGKELRNVMMLYRKLLTKLRKTGLDVVRIPSEPATKIEGNWDSLLSVLAEYKRANDIVDATLTDCANGVEASTNAVVASEVVVVVEAASTSEAVASEAVASEAVASEAVASEAVASEAVASEVEASEAVVASEVVASEAVVASEVVASEAVAESTNAVVESDAVVESTNAVAENEAEPEMHPSEKNNSWLYKLFGW
jgi:hypothetical protein